MALVCAIFIQNPLSVATASGAIGSISIGVIGYLSWWHLNLDPVSLCAVLMSIGMSVDFTAHVSYHFQVHQNHLKLHFTLFIITYLFKLSHKREIRNGQIVEIPLKLPRDKLYNAIQAIAWPMSQAGLSTVICVLPLIFLQVIIFNIFYNYEIFLFAELYSIGFCQNNLVGCHLGSFPWSGAFACFFGRTSSTLAGTELLSNGRAKIATNGRTAKGTAQCRL
jgi:uncharacterized membrane protein YfcA